MPSWQHTHHHHHHYYHHRTRVLLLLSPRSILVCILGILLGFTVSLCIQSLNCLPTASTNICPSSALLQSSIEPDPPQLLLVGIMTAQQYVDTRAYNVWRTWARHIPGQVLFFVAEHTVSEHADMPLIRLRGVDDTYPPQRKSFAMLRWMADHQLDRFQWFMRADDDLYVRGDRIESLLRSLDADKPILLGQAGLGTGEEYGQLSLAADENYCMGGPGIVLSRETLRTVRPHLADCLRNMFTTHEDVELGRCIRRHVGMSCTWNYQMQTIFYNNQSGRAAYTGNLNVEEVHQATSLHPIKAPTLMRRMHSFVSGQRMADMRTTRLALNRDLHTCIAHLRRLDAMTDDVESHKYEQLGAGVSLFKHTPRTHADILHWDFVSSSNVLFCTDLLNCPRHTAESYLRSALQNAIRQIFDQFNRNARQRGRVLQFQNIQYAYTRVDPVHGADYVIDMILWFKKFRGPHRATISVRRHAYVQQTFGELEAIDDIIWQQTEMQHVESARAYAPPHFDNNGNTPPIVTEITRETIVGRTIHLVLPLAGRADTFKRFAAHLRNVYEEQKLEGDVALIIVLFASGSAEQDAIIATNIDELRKHLTDVRVVNMADQTFSRGVALMRGAASVDADALLFFTDVDMLFTADALRRIRLNTILGAQVYFPIVFSEYSPETWSHNDRLYADAFHYGRRRGYFRHFGFGLVSLFRADLDRVGGLDTNIHGWGMEDVDLFEKCLKQPYLRVFRAPDPGLVHIYHPISCPKSMPSAQYHMCIGSKAASSASLDSLADQLIASVDTTAAPAA